MAESQSTLNDFRIHAMTQQFGMNVKTSRDLVDKTIDELDIIIFRQFPLGSTIKCDSSEIYKINFTEDTAVASAVEADDTPKLHTMDRTELTDIRGRFNGVNFVTPESLHREDELGSLVVGFVLFNFGKRTADNQIPQENYYFCPLETTQLVFGIVDHTEYFGTYKMGLIDKCLADDFIDFRGLSGLFANIGDDPDAQRYFLEYINIRPISYRVSAVTLHQPNQYDEDTDTVVSYNPVDFSVDVGAVFSGTNTNRLRIKSSTKDAISAFIECESIEGYYRRI